MLSRSDSFEITVAHSTSPSKFFVHLTRARTYIHKLRLEAIKPARRYCKRNVKVNNYRVEGRDMLCIEERLSSFMIFTRLQLGNVAKKHSTFARTQAQCWTNTNSNAMRSLCWVRECKPCKARQWRQECVTMARHTIPTHHSLFMQICSWENNVQFSWIQSMHEHYLHCSWE